MLRVVSAVIINDGRILLTQRKRTAEFPWTWECPGGKVEGDEYDDAALKREIYEELGVKAKVGHLIFSDEYGVPLVKKPLTIHHYVTHIIAGTPFPLEAEGIGWFTAEDVQRLDACLSLGRHREDIIRAMKACR